MLGILLKTIPVNLRRDAGTYILMCLLVAAGMFIVADFVGITYSYEWAAVENRVASNSEDGQFQVAAPLDDRQEQAIRDKGYQLERAFYFDADLDDGSVLRIMKLRKLIDLVVVSEGALPQSDAEAVLEKCYAFYHSLHASDTIRVADEDLLISGIGSATDYEMPAARMDDFNSDSMSFGLAFVTDDCYDALLSKLGSDTREMYVYAYKLAEDATDEDLRDMLVEDLGMLSSLVAFAPRENNYRMGTSESDNSVYGVAGMLTGLGLLVLISLVFFLRIQLTLDKQSPSIGALLAMGVKKRDIFPMLLVPFALVALIGGLAGFGLSRVFPLAEVAGGEGFYSIPEVPMITHPIVFLYCVVMPPLVCTIVNLLLMRKKMSQPAASLLVASREGVGGNRGIVIAIVVGSLVAATIFMLGRGVGMYSAAVEDRLPDEIRYGYVYHLAEDQANLPAGAQGAFQHAFSVEDHGYIRNVQFIGVEDGAPYFDVQVEGLDGGVVISTAVASRYGLGVGDTLSVFDPLTTEEHTFEIKGTTDYSVQLSVFMDIGDLRSLLGKEGIAYNTAYSDAPLGFEKAQLDGSATKEQLIAPVEQLGPEVQGSRDSFYALAILFYAVMMVYLIQFAVVRRRRDAASLAAIGYGNGELIWFLAGKLLIVACASALVCLFVGYEISVLLMPTLVASTPIGLMIDYPLPEYLLHLACALAIIALAAFLGLRRIAHTDNLYYLRNRE